MKRNIQHAYQTNSKTHHADRMMANVGLLGLLSMTCILLFVLV